MPAVGSVDQALMSDNALSVNALSVNALSVNALSVNALSVNGLELAGNDLSQSAAGRHVLKYVVRCALGPETVLTAEVEGVTYAFPGLLELAPEWLSDGLDSDGERLISACLLAHVNHFGISVAISTRHDSLPVTAEELDRFEFYEGSFFGDLFADPPKMFACTGDAGPSFSVAYPNHDTSTGDRLLRRCTDVEGATTTCGFVSVGSCASACDNSVGGSHHDCWSGPGHSGTRYRDVVSVWLLDDSDSWSSWPTGYPAYYGP